MWKVSVVGVLLVPIFPHLNWIRRNTPYLSDLSKTRENTDQKNSEYRHLYRSDINRFV